MGNQKKKMSDIFNTRNLMIAIPIIVILTVGFIFFSLDKKGENNTTAASLNELKEYDDVRTVIMGGREVIQKDIRRMDLTKAEDILPTLWFNKDTKWPDKSKMPAAADPEAILNNAMNPGLGVRELHAQGITGKGIHVAIIDQPLYDDHPEFKGKIAAYKDFDCKSESSMHGPAVASLLVGENIGTAPDARIYYAATPTWNADAAYQAQALEWIIEENRKLHKNDKIRVVSISAAPSGPGSPFTKNNEKWDAAVEQAEKEGILILDCTQNHGVIGPAYFSDVKNMENVSKCLPGFPGLGGGNLDGEKVMVPISPRTTAEEYTRGNVGYQYTGRGGLSWAIPYCAGVLAMGWQVNPELTSNEMMDLLFKSACKNNGALIINPREFIKLIQERK